MWKIIFVECCPIGGQWGGVHRDPNAIAGAAFFKHMPEDAGGKHVKVKKRRHQDILHFRADALENWF